jgi:hypothetical protein
MRQIRTSRSSVGIDHELHSAWEQPIVDENDEAATAPHPRKGSSDNTGRVLDFERACDLEHFICDAEWQGIVRRPDPDLAPRGPLDGRSHREDG